MPRLGSRMRPYVLVLLGLTIVLMTKGLGLWADVPGPKPDPDVRVESFRPRGNTDQAVNIVVTFSNALVSPDSVNRPVESIPVEITPPINAMARWTDTNVLMIFPSRPLNPATTYKAVVKAGGGYVNGNAIKRNEQFTFTTPPLSVEVSQYQPQRVQENRRQGRIVFDLKFNYPVSRKDLEEHLKIEGLYGTTEKRLTILWPDTASDGTPYPSEDTWFRLSTQNFDLNNSHQRYQLTLPKEFRCVDCGNGLGYPFSYVMSVPPNPRMELIVTEVSGMRSGKDGRIYIGLSSQVPVEQLRDHVSLEPAVPFTVQSSWRGGYLTGHFEPQTSYTVKIVAGIVASDGSMMSTDFAQRVIMPDLEPVVRFTSPGVYLPRDGNRLLEISSTNIDTLFVQVTQIFANNIVTYMATGSDRSGRYSGNFASFGRRTFTKNFPLDWEKNKELTSTIDVGAIIGDTLQGVFLVSAASKHRTWVGDSRQVMITDLGAMARLSDDYLLVWVNSLSETKPVGGAKVKLFSRNNQLMVEGKTNSKGVAEFDDLAELTKDFQPFLITVEKNGDLSYLRLDDTRLSTSDFDVSGRPYLTSGYEAFIYFDRGVYRPGGEVHIVSLVRGKDGATPESFPYTLKIVDARGQDFHEYRLTADRSMGSIDVDLPTDIPTGKYKVIAYLSDNYVLGQTDFLVEEFVPDRIRVDVKLDSTEYYTGDKMEVSVSGQMLYGAPAAGLKVTSNLVLSPVAFQPQGYSSYSFSMPEKKYSVKRESLGEAVLSDSGTATFHYTIEKGQRPPGRLSAQVWGIVTENGGRSVSSYAEAVVNPYQRYVGIRSNLKGYARTNEPVNADIVVIKPDGTPISADSIRVLFSRVVYNSVLQVQSDGSYRWKSERTLEPFDSTWVDVTSKGSTVTFTPATYGHYQILVRDAVDKHEAAVEFFATGWGRVPWSLAEPDHLQLDLDQTEYAPGSRAKLQVRAPFGGRLLVTVENQTVQEYKVLDIPENTGLVELDVKKEYAPNVYVSATLIRPASELKKGMPARAYGIIPLKVTAENRNIDVKVTAPEEIRPNTKLTVNVRTNGSEQAQLTVAAVDVGILQLTNFRTPDPFGFFYGKRRPALAGYDLYSMIFPEAERAASNLSPPGGASAKMRAKRHLNPFQAKRVNIVALWTGILQVDSAGNAEVNLDIPQFNGQLEIMTVVADGQRFGSGSAAVQVRQPIILQESFPRFVAPDDIVSGLVTVFNGLDSTATIKVQADITGQASLRSDQPKMITLDKGAQGVVKFPFDASKVPGTADVTLTASAGTEKTTESFELANRPASPLQTQFGSGAVTGDSAITFTMPTDFVDGTAEYVLQTSSLVSLQISRNIEYVLKYPYGCVEQTTSGLFPLLYFSDVAKIVRPQLLGGNAQEYYLTLGIQRLLRYQMLNGSFAYWPGWSGFNLWSSIYASHFLVEAKLAGYEIDKSAYNRSLGFLEKVARNDEYSDIKAPQRVYACLVLAKAGKLDHKMFNYLSSLNTRELPVYTTYQLAEALAIGGDVERAKELVPMDIQPDLSPPETGGNLSSGVRNDAILLDLLLYVEPQSSSIPVLAKSLLERARLNRWYNTQATAFALVALGKYFREIQPEPFTGTIRIEGKKEIKIDTADFSMTSKDLGGRGISISIDGKGPCYFYWQASGIPLKGQNAEYNRGIRVTRDYLDASGKPVDLSWVEVGTQLVARITITSDHGAVKNVVIADLLPAAFEIENPRLANTPQMPWLPPKPTKPSYEDIRDDRILLFVDLPEKQTQSFYYGIRVVSAGDFTVPPVAAECMYNPLIAGAGSSGRVIVNAPTK